MPDADDLLRTTMAFAADLYGAASASTLDGRMSGVWLRCAAAARTFTEDGLLGVDGHEDHHEQIGRYLKRVDLDPMKAEQVAVGLRAYLGLATISEALDADPDAYSGKHRNVSIPAAETIIDCFAQHAIDAYVLSPLLQVSRIDAQALDAAQRFSFATMEPAIDILAPWYPEAFVHSAATLSVLITEPRIEGWRMKFLPYVVHST